MSGSMNSPGKMSRAFLMMRRFLVILAIGFWLGGFTFYASVVIHTGHRVFGSRLEVGFLTQQVTRWLNVSSVVADFAYRLGRTTRTT